MSGSNPFFSNKSSGTVAQGTPVFSGNDITSVSLDFIPQFFQYQILASISGNLIAYKIETSLDLSPDPEIVPVDCIIQSFQPMLTPSLHARIVTHDLLGIPIQDHSHVHPAKPTDHHFGHINPPPLVRTIRSKFTSERCLVALSLVSGLTRKSCFCISLSTRFL